MDILNNDRYIVKICLRAWVKPVTLLCFSEVEIGTLICAKALRFTTVNTLGLSMDPEMPPSPREGILLNRMQLKNRKILLILVMFVFWSWCMCMYVFCWILTFAWFNSAGVRTFNCGCVFSGSFTTKTLSKQKLVNRTDFDVGSTLGHPLELAHGPVVFVVLDMSHTTHFYVILGTCHMVWLFLCYTGHVSHGLVIFMLYWARFT